MRKKILCILLCAILLGGLALPAYATPEGPQITFQPQNPNYPEYSVASYTVKATGTNLQATWWMEWNGTTYNISQVGGSTQPWEGYAGETYGATEPEPGVFTYVFGGIGRELNGARIWCVIEDGHYDVVSQKAYITIGNPNSPPVIEQIPAKIVVDQGKQVDVRCLALSPGNTQLSYTWYETSTGHLEDIVAMERGGENSDFIIPDTGTVGVRYYVCMVRTNEGGIAYSSIVEVWVQQPQATQPTETQPTETQPDPTEVTEEIAPTQSEIVEEETTMGLSVNGKGLVILVVFLLLGLLVVAAVILLIVILLIARSRKKKKNKKLAQAEQPQQIENS